MGYLNSKPKLNLIQQTQLHEMSVCLAVSFNVQNLPSHQVIGLKNLIYNFSCPLKQTNKQKNGLPEF